MRNRVAVVTGASSGLGLETAKALAGMGWRVVALGRDPARTAAAETAIAAAAAAGGSVTMIRVDLSRMAEVERAAAAIAAATDRVDLLVNNAGGMTTGLATTPEGLEENFAGNHLGPFLLTERLVPLLRRAAADAPAGAVRIVNTSSDGSEMIPGLNWDDLQLLECFQPGRAYCQAKLANVMHARGLARRLADAGIVVHAVHPGTIDSNFISHADATTQAHIRTRTAMSSQEGAEAIVWLATGDEPGRSSGGYWHGRQPAPPNPVALDDDAVERLWRESERMVASARS